jgi:hypothetical protein
LYFFYRGVLQGIIAKFFLADGKQVLTKNKNNILVDSVTGFKAVKNDVLLSEMEKKPTLIANLLQYTPADLTLNLIDGTNVEKGDVLYGWRGRGLVY